MSKKEKTGQEKSIMEIDRKKRRKQKRREEAIYF
jgi:hypothetical protein